MNTRPRIIYLSGPMTGWPDNNRATFHRAAAAQTRRGQQGQTTAYLYTSMNSTLKRGATAR
jgi:hypothetical protein